MPLNDEPRKNYNALFPCYRSESAVIEPVDKVLCAAENLGNDRVRIFDVLSQRLRLIGSPRTTNGLRAWDAVVLA